MTTTLKHWVTALNTQYHRTALNVFLVIVLAHWAEHVAQAIQIWVLGWPIPSARSARPVVPLAGHVRGAALRLCPHHARRFYPPSSGFTGPARTWWTIALGIQVWHHIEHLLLLAQAQTGLFLLGNEVPTSVVQLVVPRVQLHLFYNTVVFIPMIVAMLHRRPSPSALDTPSCTCAQARVYAQA